uniref:Uncharacterized protein n=1 Tax=Strigops habroptila TaxID=2489341 RepID=A0A672V662_STRHB
EPRRYQGAVKRWPICSEAVLQLAWPCDRARKRAGKSRIHDLREEWCLNYVLGQRKVIPPPPRGVGWDDSMSEHMYQVSSHLLWMLASAAYSFM